MLMSAFARQVHGELDEGKSPTGGRLVRIRMPRMGSPAASRPGSSATGRQMKPKALRPGR